MKELSGFGSCPSGRRLWRSVLAGLLLGIVIAWGFFWWLFKCHCSYNPFDLRHPTAIYVLDIPDFVSYCCVPLGTPESEITSRFGPPCKEFDTNSQEWHNRLTGWRRCGWSVPSPPYRKHVLLYWPYGSSSSLMVYYFIDEDGYLVNTFVGET